MTDSLRARILINLSAVLYKQSAARPSLSAEVSNIDLNFVPSVAFISDVYIADSLRARILINLSAVLNIDLNFVLSVTFISDVYIADSLRARTLINLSAVLYNPRARTLINLSAVSIIDLNFVPSVAFNAIGNVELTGDLLGDADCVNNNNNNSDADLGDDNNVQLVRDNIEELIYVSKVKNNHNNLNIIVTDPTGREFGRVDIKSLTRLSNVADVFNTVVSKSDEVPTRELSSYIKIELYLRKFYRLIITSEDTHCKQIIKKAYIMLLERALLILFMI
ncbi:hypothetical protein HBH44_026340 [Parastagonospora nodorum]|nr:hypothetical protein HBH54_088320 [Parastagonospora nodorum]KAH4171800.1 hypothetical protein HBH44_026340 [Parastagonospora nodorum]KAH4616622.1 hypothetical protein HBH55_203140 [Parastagonospora nodorum]KAH4646198.1 hypothetical protein HBH81_038170 [Parastagonospora nodorum]